MADFSKITWTTHTWNPWRGCRKVSTGCAQCYMFRDQKRYGKDPTMIVRSKDGTFYQPHKYKDPARVFTCSWSDFFIPEADGWRQEAWKIIFNTPHLTYQILTKRPHLITSRLPASWFDEPYPNVWLGVSVEDQHSFDSRWPVLAGIPAAVRFLSAEPLLAPFSLNSDNHRLYHEDLPMPDWVIVGGESGSKHRAMKPEWALNLRRECGAFDIPYFFKQHAAVKPGEDDVLYGKQYHEFPE